MKLSEALRERQGEQSLRSMADELGVAVGTVEGWLKGWRSPSLRHIPAIADYLGEPVGDVVIYALEEATSGKGVYLSSLAVA